MPTLFYNNRFCLESLFHNWSSLDVTLILDLRFLHDVSDRVYISCLLIFPSTLYFTVIVA